MHRSTWKLKVLVQFVLSHVPGGERLNYALQNARGSHSGRAIRAKVLGYADKVCRVQHSLDDAVVVEIGTGWEPVGALILSLAGARSVHTYDHVRHLRYELAIETVTQMIATVDQLAVALDRPSAELMERLGVLRRCPTLDALLREARITYIAPGDGSQTGLTDHSCDVVWSYAVLEHVSPSVVTALTREAARILRPDGVAYHGIGLQDHYASGSKVNFLRYRERWWSFFVYNRISYTNRLREPEYLELFRSAGGHVDYVWAETDPSDLEAVKSMPLDARFRSMSPEELAVTHLEVVLSFAPSDAETKVERSGVITRSTL